MPDDLVVPLEAPVEETLAPDPKEVAKAAFKKETEELVAQAKAESAAGAAETTTKAKKKEPLDEIKEEIEKEAGAKETKKEESPPRKLKLTIDGEEVEHDESEVIRLAQIAKASQNREHLATKTAKQAAAFVKALKEDPESVLSHKSLGLDLEVLAEKILWKRLQESLKTPEDKAREAQEKEHSTQKEELDRYRKRDQDAEAEAKAGRIETLKEQYRQDWTQKFSAALDSVSIPRDDWTLNRMAQYMRAGLKSNPGIQPKDVAHLVEADWHRTQKTTLTSLDGDELMKYLGEEVAEKVRKAQLKKFQEKEGGDAPAKENSQGSKTPKKVWSSVEEMLRQ